MALHYKRVVQFLVVNVMRWGNLFGLAEDTNNWIIMGRTAGGRDIFYFWLRWLLHRNLEPCV